jgi:hypothetical protein
MILETPAPTTTFDPRCLELRRLTRYRTRSGCSVEISIDGTGAYHYNVTGPWGCETGSCGTEGGAQRAAEAVLKMRGCA